MTKLAFVILMLQVARPVQAADSCRELFMTSSSRDVPFLSEPANFNYPPMSPEEPSEELELTVMALQVWLVQQGLLYNQNTQRYLQQAMDDLRLNFTESSDESHVRGEENHRNPTLASWSLARSIGSLNNVERIYVGYRMLNYWMLSLSPSHPGDVGQSQPHDRQYILRAVSAIHPLLLERTILRYFENITQAGFFEVATIPQQTSWIKNFFVTRQLKNFVATMGFDISISEMKELISESSRLFDDRGQISFGSLLFLHFDFSSTESYYLQTLLPPNSIRDTSLASAHHPELLQRRALVTRMLVENMYFWHLTLKSLREDVYNLSSDGNILERLQSVQGLVEQLNGLEKHFVQILAETRVFHDFLEQRSQRLEATGEEVDEHLVLMLASDQHLATRIRQNLQTVRTLKVVLQNQYQQILSPL